MSRFVKSLVIFMAGLQLLPTKASNDQKTMAGAAGEDDLKAVTLQPLNGRYDNLFAGHSSHSSHRSHASHASHYSGAGGSPSRYVPPVAASAAQVKPVELPLQPADPIETPANFRSSVNTGVVTPSSATTAPRPFLNTVNSDATGTEVPMTRAEKLHLQVVRVQIRLNSLGLFNGAISGKFDGETRAALRLFQKVKSLPENGLMTTPTLNALGIPAVK